MDFQSVAQKIISFISSLSLLFQALSPLAYILPAKVYANDALKAEIDFNKDSNTFTLKVNNKDVNADGPIEYVLVYRTDKGQNEAIKGTTDKPLQDNLQKDLYAGTCSANSTCSSDAVVRGILKVKDESQSWFTALKFSIDDGKLKLVEEYKPTSLDLSDAENYWLEQGKEPSPTPTITPLATLTPTPTVVENGQILDGISTTKDNQPVELGKQYTAPFNDKLKIVFTKLPDHPGTLTIRELYQSFNVDSGEQVGSAYEITSNMANGTFLYDLTLPVPVDSQGNLEGTSEKEETADVSYSEDGKEFNSVANEKSLDKNNHVITIKNLDHFTIFVLVANPSGITNGMLSIIGDTYIKQDSGGNDNFGGSDPINIYSQTTNKNRRILIKFDLTAIPSGSTATTATLKLKMTNAPGTSRQYDVYRATSSWDENTVTWNSQPSIAGSSTSSVSSGTTNNVVLSWDVTTDVNAFLSGTVNNGWMIRDNAEDSTSANTNQASFASKENNTNSNRPQLSIDFSIASPANTGPASSGGFDSPSAQSSVTSSSGDSDGYGTSPANAFSGDGTFATDSNSGANNNSDCSNSGTGVDRHIFNNYGLTVPTGATVNGIEVRQDLKVSSLADSPFTCVQLSWDGGTTWTSVKQKSLTSTDLTPYYFGSSTDSWGRSWSISDFSDANFRVRVANGDTNDSSSDADFSLDWIPVRVYYTQDITAPTLTEVTPVSSPTTDSTPNYTFNSNEAGTITYGGDCSSNTASAVSGVNTITFNSLSDGTHSNCTITVTDTIGNASTALNVSSFTIDTTPPQTTIDSGPSGSVNNTSATFTFSANETSSFQCQIDSGGFSTCNSGSKTYNSLGEGLHTFEVKATDAVGNTDASPASRTWTVDTTLPTLTSVNISSNNANSNLAKVGNTVTVAFTSSENISTPTVTIAGNSATVTGSNTSWSGSYTMTSGDTEGATPFSIDFSDLAGNSGTQVTVTSDSSSVTFDKTGPSVLFDSTPTSVTNSTSASFSFHADESGSTFECLIDSGSYSLCSSPKNYSGLGDGSHTFSVRATDQAGNTGDSSNYLWTIDATAPNDPTNVHSTSHTTNTPSTNDIISMEWTVATDNSGGAGINGYGYTFDNSSSWTCDQVKLLSGSATAVSSGSLADGNWYFHICTKDNAENWTSTEHAGPFIIDKTSPVLQSFSSTKTNGAYGPGTVINVTASFNETLRNTSSMTVVLDTGATVTVNTVSGSNIAGNYTVGAIGSGENSSDLTVSSISSTNAVDVAGNPHAGTTLPASNIADTSNIVVDTAAPTLSSVHLASNNGNSNSLAKVGDIVTLSFTSNETISAPTVSIAGHSVSATNTSGNNWSATYTMVSGDSEESVGFSVDFSDSVGNAGSQVTSTTDASSVIFDKTAPTTNDSGIDAFWHNADVSVTLSCSDGTGSGCGATYHTTNGTTPTTSSATGNPFTLTSNGEYTIKYFSVDAAGNEETVKTASNTIKIDKTAPVDPSVNSTSHTTSVWSTDNTIDISWSGATDNLSGVAGYSYLFDTAATTLPDEISEGFGTSTASAVLADGNSHYFHLRTIDNAGNWTSTVHKGPFYIDTTNPNTPTASPPAGDYSSHPSVTLASSDATSGIAAIYYTIDGTTPNATKSLYSSPILITTDTTIKAIAYDNAGNTSGILTAVYGIAPIISSQTSFTLSGTSARINWTTDIPSTSRVIYDTVSHDVGSAPNYGYANTTSEDVAKVLSHSITITGLSDGITYYYRTVSHGSPEAVSDEKYFGTFSRTSGNTGDGKGDGLSSGGGGAVAAVPAVAGATTAFNPAVAGVPAEVLGASSPEAELTASPSSEEVLGKMKGREVKSESKLPKILLGFSLVILGSLVLMYLKKRKDKPLA